MPSSLRSGAQVDNNKVAAVNYSGGGVAVENTNNEGSPEQQVSPSEVQYSLRTGVNDFQNNGGCSESSDIATDDITANTFSSIRNNNKVVTTNANHLTTVKTKDIKKRNIEGTPTFNGKHSTNKQGGGINGWFNDIDWFGIDASTQSSYSNNGSVEHMIPLVEEAMKIKGYETKDSGVTRRCIIRNALVDACKKDELSTPGHVLVATENLVHFNPDKDLLLRPIQHESTIDAEMKCEGRGSIVTSPVDVMDDIHGSTTASPNKQSCSSFPLLEEGKRSEDVGVTSKDILQECVEKITKPTASSPSVEDDVDFADSEGGIDMDVDCACKSIEGVNVLDAFQCLEDTTGAVEGNDEMDIGELVEAAIASPLDTAAIDAAVEACNNINAGGDGVTQVLDKNVVGGINVLDDATIVRKCSKLGLSELCHAIGVVSTNVSVVFNIFRACTKLYDGGIKDEQFVVARSKLSGVQVMYCKSNQTGYIVDEDLHLLDEDLPMADEEDSSSEQDADWSKYFWDIVLSDSTRAAPSADRFENLVNVEPHLVQEHMIYGKESTQLLYCDPKDYPSIVRRKGRDKVFATRPATLGYNRNIEDILFTHSDEAVKILIDADLVTNLKDIDLASTPAVKRSLNFGIIYALYKLGILIKIGITFNVPKREDKYREQFLDYDENYKMIELVAFDSIPSKVEQKLSDIFWRLADCIIANETTPEGMALLWTNMRDRGWHRGGEKKHGIIQLIEFGLQRHENLPRQTWVGEAFSWDEIKCEDLTTEARKVAQELVDMVGSFSTLCPETNERIPIVESERAAISTWITGAKKGVVTSFEAHINHFLDDSGTFEDVIKKPLYPDATTTAKIFASDFPNEWYAHAYASYYSQLEYFFCNRMEPIIKCVMVDAQNFMFGSNLFEPQRVFIDIGYKYRGEALGGELIVYRAGNVVLFLHGHPSIASDSRQHIKIETKQLRAIALDGIKGGVDIITGELDNVENITTFNTHGSLIAEHLLRGFHASRPLVSAIQRDLQMPDGKSAIDSYRGKLTPNDKNHPCTIKARQTDGDSRPSSYNTKSDDTKEIIREIAERGVKVRAGNNCRTPNNWILNEMKNLLDSLNKERDTPLPSLPFKKEDVRNKIRALEAAAEPKKKPKRKVDVQQTETTAKKKKRVETQQDPLVDGATIPKKRKEEWRPSREQLAHVEALKRKRAETPLVISKPETIVMAKKKQSLSFTITKPDSGRFGLTLCDLKVSHCGDINCTTKVMKVASGSAFEGTPLKTGMTLEFINTYKCFSHERAVELLRKATGEIKIIASLYT